MNEERLEDAKTIYGLSDKTILYVGTSEPRKNIGTLINAFLNWKKERIAHQVVLAGRNGWVYKEIFKTIKRLGLINHMKFKGEVCRDAAYYVNPYDVESIAEGMYKVLTDENLRQSLIQKGLERVKLFSWEKSAREHLRVFEEVLLRSP